MSAVEPANGYHGYLNYGFWLDCVELALNGLARYGIEGLSYVFRKGIPACILSLPRFQELSTILGEREALGQLLVETIEIRFGNPPDGRGQFMLALFGLHPQLHDSPGIAREALAQEIISGGKATDWWHGLRAVYFARKEGCEQLAVALSVGMRSSTHRGEVPVAVQSWWCDYVSGVRAGGSQAPVVNSWVIASRVSMPHLVAVDR